MSRRGRPARERLEIYLMQLLLAYRPFILGGGILLLIYALAISFIFPLAGMAGLVPAIFLLLLGGSYHAVLYTARLAAWIGTLGRREG